MIIRLRAVVLTALVRTASLLTGTPSSARGHGERGSRQCVGEPDVVEGQPQGFEDPLAYR